MTLKMQTLLSFPTFQNLSEQVNHLSVERRNVTEHENITGTLSLQ
jgi:hypothetical protein